MQIINWGRSRFSAKRESRGFDVGVPEEQWRPEEDQETGGLLSIGTFGEKKDAKPTTFDQLPEFTIEEAEKLQDALEKLLLRARSKSSARRGDDSLSLPLDRSLNCPSSLEVDRRVLRQKHDDEGGDTKIVLTMAKDLLASCSGSNRNNKGAGIKNNSFKFLLRKMLVCNGGFAPAPSMKDPVESRMDKFFRTVLGRKINVRPTNATAAKKYCLEDKRFNGKSRGGHCRDEDGDGDGEKEEDCCRWDRTDSEFIVLEI